MSFLFHNPRRDRYTTNTGFLNRLGNQPRSFYVLDKFTKVIYAGLTAFWNAERLLNRHEPAREHTRSGKPAGVSHEVLSSAAEHVNFARNHQLEGSLRAGHPHQLSVF